MADAKAIKAVAVDEVRMEETRAKKELKGKDQAAALGAAHAEEAVREQDAKQMEDVAVKEKKDAAATRKEAAKVKHDATKIELEHDKEDALELNAVAADELREAKVEESQSNDAMADAKAIKAVAVDEAKMEEKRAKKELKGKDL